MTTDELAAIAKALAHPARVRIVELLSCETECRGQEIFSELPLAQSTISEHLRVLKDARLVTSHAVGTAMVYCLDAARLASFSQHLAEIAERDVCAPTGLRTERPGS